MSPSLLRSASVVFGLMGGFAQVCAAFLGYAIGGASIAVILLAFDAVAAFVGAAIVSRSTTGGMSSLRSPPSVR